MFALGFNVDTAVYVMNPNGTDVKEVPRCFGCNQTEWFPDGSRIAYLQAGGIYVVNADGSGRRLVARTNSRFGWFSLSPDGSTFAYVGGRGPGYNRYRYYNRYLYVVNVDSSGRKVVAHSSTLRYWAPEWRPAG